MSVQRITNIFMLVVALLSITVLIMPFSSLYQSENLGEGISVKIAVKLPKKQEAKTTDSYSTPKRERIWNDSKVIEIIEPAPDRTER